MRYIFIRHAVQAMMEDGITRREVKEILLKGMKFGPDSRGRMHARMKGIEVVYEKRADLYKIITVFIAKR